VGADADFILTIVMKYKIISYNPKLKTLAHDLRKNSTLSEVLLWNYLKNKQMLDYNFNRQKPIDEYIVDFYCPELYLVIEIDGCTHGDKIKQDELRQKRLEDLGCNILHFSDRQVKRDMNSVLRTISWWIKELEEKIKLNK
jgi:very-short-patch-repair endonuclease